MKRFNLILVLLFAAVLSMQAQEYVWSAAPMDGSRTGCASATKDNVQEALGTFVNGKYHAPNGKIYKANSTVAKVSAGAVEYTPVARVTNIASTIDKLKEQGLWIAGTALEESSIYTNADLTGALAIVIGSEGEGLSRLTREKCDFLVKKQI